MSFDCISPKGITPERKTTGHNSKKKNNSDTHTHRGQLLLDDESIYEISKLYHV